MEELSDAQLGSEQLCFLVNSNSVYLEEEKKSLGASVLLCHTRLGEVLFIVA